MSDTPLLDHDNPRVAAYARATGADRIDHEYNLWIRDMMREACEAGEAGDFRGVFRFDGNGEPHINDHDAFTAYLIERATEIEAGRTESEPPAGP